MNGQAGLTDCFEVQTTAGVLSQLARGLEDVELFGTMRAVEDDVGIVLREDIDLDTVEILS
jgi:hypothetical protein